MGVAVSGAGAVIRRYKSQIGKFSGSLANGTSVNVINVTGKGYLDQLGIYAASSANNYMEIWADGSLIFSMQLSGLVGEFGGVSGPWAAIAGASYPYAQWAVNINFLTSLIVKLINNDTSAKNHTVYAKVEVEQ